MDVPLYQHWKDVHVRRWLIVLTAMAAGVIAYFGSLAMTPVYEAKTTFFLAANSTPASYSSSSQVNPQSPLFPIPEEKAASLDVGILRGVKMMTRLAEDVGMNRSDLQSQTDITVSGEFMIDAFVRDPDPEVARDIANRIPVLYKEFHETSMRQRSEAVADATDAQLAFLEAQAETLRLEQQSLRAASLSTADAVALGRLQAERDAAIQYLRAVESDIQQSYARRVAIDVEIQAEANLYRDGKTIDTTNAIDDMLKRILELQVDLSSVTDGVANPRRTSIEGQISEIEEAMNAERQRLADASAKPQGSLFESMRLERALNEARIAELLARKDAADGNLTSISARFDDILLASSQGDELRQALEVANVQIAALRDKATTARLQADNAVAPVVVIGEAESPARAAFPLPILNTVVAVICGAILGIYYTIFIAHTERVRHARKSASVILPIFTDEEMEVLRSGKIPDQIFRKRGGSDE